jgi:hypothetical protein
VFNDMSGAASRATILASRASQPFSVLG